VGEESKVLVVGVSSSLLLLVLDVGSSYENSYWDGSAFHLVSSVPHREDMDCSNSSIVFPPPLPPPPLPPPPPPVPKG